VLSVILGTRRMVHSDTLRTDDIINEIYGWEKRHGKQKGTAINSDPRKKRLPSHQPPMAFCGETQILAHGRMRPGKTTDNNNLEAFFRSRF